MSNGIITRARGALAQAGFLLDEARVHGGWRVTGRRDSDERPFLTAFGLSREAAWSQACALARVQPIGEEAQAQ